MENRVVRIGPTAITNAVANILNPPTLTGGVGVTPTNTYLLLTHLRVTNKTTSGVAISLWIGATGASAAGTEFAWTAENVPPNGHLDWYGEMRMDPADFLTALAAAATSLTIAGEAELGVA